MSTIRDRTWGVAVALRLLARALRQSRPQQQSLTERLAQLPPDLPVANPVTIHWDPHHIPFIEADSDADLPVALGAVHAHLRLTQLELLRRIAQGRLSELVGPLGIELDRALRLFDFARAVPRTMAALSPESRAWAEGFIAGINHVIAHAPPPPEFALLDLRAEPWTLADLLTSSRLAGADVSWIVWSRLLRTQASLSEAAWRALWPRLLRGGAPPPEAGVEEAVGAFARTGSNAAAVAGWRSASGSALFAADPHLSVALPNIWLACAFRSPGYNVAGLMPAGFPIVAIGRNPHLAWGGTSLHAASSELYDASALPLTERRDTIRVRGAADRVLTLRESPLGPVVSDGMILKHATPLALRWIGHAPSDEMGAMLGVMRARDGREFRAALADFAIPGQNMIYAAADGSVGHLLAARVPRRKPGPPADLVSAPATAGVWDDPVGTEELPHWADPPEGFVASANDRPPDGAVPVGFFFSPSDRVERIRTLLGGDRKVGLTDMAAWQLDVAAPTMLAVRDRLLARIGPAHASQPAVRALAAWTGDYAQESQGALVYEALIAELVARLGRSGGLPPVQAVFTSRQLTAEDILAVSDARLQPALTQALRAVGRSLRRYRNWGGMHRMRLRHHLAAVPLLGGRFRYTDTPSPGGNDTLNKTGHGLTAKRHAVTYGASARFVADLASPDSNHLVLLGGQDGWLGSGTFLDQAELWRQGRTIAVPLRPETAQAWQRRTVFRPR
jgi:penicillin G amidase